MKKVILLFIIIIFLSPNLAYSEISEDHYMEWFDENDFKGTIKRLEEEDYNKIEKRFEKVERINKTFDRITNDIEQFCIDELKEKLLFDHKITIKEYGIILYDIKRYAEEVEERYLFINIEELSEEEKKEVSDMIDQFIKIIIKTFEKEFKPFHLSHPD